MALQPERAPADALEAALNAQAPAPCAPWSWERPTGGRSDLLSSLPRSTDTNGDGIPDGAAKQAGLSLTNTDMDGDGVSNATEAARGTDPFIADTDGDGVADGADCFPLDPTRWQCPLPNPNDHTPPLITLQQPTPPTAELIDVEPPP